VQPRVIAPQLLLSLVLFPIIARMVAMLDRLRLMRVRRID
jgi:rod shape-determining protein MreD